MKQLEDMIRVLKNDHPMVFDAIVMMGAAMLTVIGVAFHEWFANTQTF